MAMSCGALDELAEIAGYAMPQMLWRQKWISVATVWAVCTVGWIAVALIPTKYESSARVYLDADPVLTPLLHGLAADTNPARHLDFLQRTLLSHPNIEELVRLTDLDVGINNPERRRHCISSWLLKSRSERSLLT